MSHNLSRVSRVSRDEAGQGRDEARQGESSRESRESSGCSRRATAARVLPPTAAQREKDHVDDEQRTRSDLPCHCSSPLSFSSSFSAAPATPELCPLKGFLGRHLSLHSVGLLVVFLSLKINLSWHLHAATEGRGQERKQGIARSSACSSSQNGVERNARRSCAAAAL